MSKIYEITNYKFNDETIYTGQCIYRKVNNKKKVIPHGKGKSVHKNGCIYIGHFFNGVIHGIGRVIKPSHFIYNGEFKHGTMYGVGQMIFSKGEIKSMDGVWTDNSLNGNAIILYRNGMKYIGEISKNLKHGPGTLYFDGHRMSGIWVNNYLDGNYVIENGNATIYCNYVNDVLTYPVKIVYLNGSVYNGKCNHMYLPHGHGKMKYFNKVIYNGFWENGFREGYGFMLYPDKSYYNGTWSSDMKNGYGILFSKLGDSAIEYYWINDIAQHLERSYHY